MGNSCNSAIEKLAPSPEIFFRKWETFSGVACPGGSGGKILGIAPKRLGDITSGPIVVQNTGRVRFEPERTGTPFLFFF